MFKYICNIMRMFQPFSVACVTFLYTCKYYKDIFVRFLPPFHPNLCIFLFSSYFSARVYFPLCCVSSFLKSFIFFMEFCVKKQQLLTAVISTHRLNLIISVISFSILTPLFLHLLPRGLMVFSSASFSLLGFPLDIRAAMENAFARDESCGFGEDVYSMTVQRLGHENIPL